MDKRDRLSKSVPSILSGSWAVFRHRNLSSVMSLESLQCDISFSTVTLRLLWSPISLIHWPPRPSDLYPPPGRILGRTWRQDPRTFSRPRFRHHPGLQLGIPGGEVGKLLGKAGWKNVLEY